MTKDRSSSIEKLSYKDYYLRPAPLLLADGRWNHVVYVGRDRTHETIERKFFSASSFETREEAVAHGYAYGKQIVDGEVPNCSVDDL